MSPLQPGQKDSIVGEAHNIQHRQEQGANSAEQILTFRVERYDRDGSRLQPVPVEMRGYSMTGFLNEGDQVRVSGTWEGGLLRATRTDNAATGAVVQAKRATMTGCFVAFMVVPLIIAAVVVLIVLVSHGVIGGRAGLGMNNSPEQVLTSYCSDIQSRAYQDGYNQFSDRLKGEVSSTQFIQMWSGKFIDACVPDVIHITGNQATTTLSTHEVRTNATQTYQITLRQDGTNGWRIDSLQPQ